MNNFVFGQDPLLYSTTIPQPQTESDIKRQLDTVMAQYQAMQQQKPPQYQDPQPKEDYVGDLDNMVKGLDPVLLDSLNSNVEFIQLNAYLQEAIQKEIMRGVKNRLNADNEVVSKVKRMQQIVNDVKTEQENEDRRRMSELNEYIKHYSDMTFNEYKQLKAKKYENA